MDILRQVEYFREERKMGIVISDMLYSAVDPNDADFLSRPPPSTKKAVQSEKPTVSAPPVIVQPRKKLVTMNFMLRRSLLGKIFADWSMCVHICSNLLIVNLICFS